MIDIDDKLLKNMNNIDNILIFSIIFLIFFDTFQTISMIHFCIMNPDFDDTFPKDFWISMIHLVYLVS